MPKKSSRRATPGPAQQSADANGSPSLFRFRTVRDVLDWFAERPESGNDQWLKFKDDCRKEFAKARFDRARKYGDLAIAECRPGHVEEFLERRGEMSGHSWNHWVTALLEPFNVAARLGWIQHNPFTGVTRKKGNRGRMLTDAEWQAALDAAGPAFRRVLAFMVRTGARPQDVAGIMPDDVDLGANVIVIPADRHKTGRKTGKPRRLFLDEEMIGLVADLMTEARFAGRSDQPLFRNSHGNQWQTAALRKYFRKLREKLGLPADAKLYGSRHRFCVKLITEKGASTAEVKELAGHERITTTEIYLSSLAGEEGHLLDVLNRKPPSREPRAG